MAGKPGAVHPSKLLRDMRWVYAHGATHDTTNGRRHCRSLLVDNPKEFLAQLASLEKAVSARVALREKEAAKRGDGPAQTPDDPLDEGSVRVLDQIEVLLEEWECKNSS